MDLNKFHKYINLRCRPDRDTLCKDQLSQIGITEPKRYNAFKTKDGIIGCGMSHLSVLQEAKEKGYPYILICEDDVVFKDPDMLVKKISSLKMASWDVLLLGGNMFYPFSNHSNDAYKVSKCFTTTAYIVREHYYDTLINCWQPALQKMVQTGNRDYSLDVVWHKLQRQDNWLLVKPLQVYQRAGQSDIENKITDYKHLMLSEK